MFRSLYIKLSLVLLLVFLLLGTFLVVITGYGTEMYQQETNQKLNLDVARHIVGDLKLMQEDDINQTALKQAFHQLMVFNPSIEIYLLDTEGRILSYSAPPGKVKRSHVDLAPIKRFLQGNTQLPLTGDDPRNSTGHKVFSAHPIMDQGRLQGYLYVILGGELYDNIAQRLETSYISKLTTGTILAAIIVSLGAALLVFAVMTRRLRRLATDMRQFRHTAASGTQTPRLARRDNPLDEIDELNNDFYHLATELERYIRELRRADTLRRELVANVSHDLRTPLATMQGYVETLILKKEALTEPEQDQYLGIVLQHCHRLNKLVQELFELARLDARETVVRPEAFNLPELLQDVVQKFLLRAGEKNIEIQTDIEDGIPFVTADIALIERVVENLLDNALRHTPEGGSIRIEVHRKPGGIAVALSDTGIGIPEQELPNVFDRFYKVDKSRNLESKSSGLGLAISKRILELHDSDIEVVSELNQGTTFCFSLPLQTASGAQH